MPPKLTLLLPLAPLFTALLAGCPTGACGDGDSTEIILLTPAEYEMWKQQGSSESPTSSPTSTTGTAGGTGGGGTIGSTGGDSTGGSSTGADTTGADTTGADTTGGETLTDQQICEMVCSQNGFTDCSVEPADANGNIPVKCVTVQFCVGRSHACVLAQDTSTSTVERDPAAHWLARSAHDEAASVHAFVALREELLAHGAPAELLARMSVAADDERRHATLTTELAQRHGALVPTPNIAPTPTRDLLALAIENMGEGCVRETWSALVAAHQARYAGTPELRDLYAGIAVDEASHAELAWSIDAWLSAQLSPAELALVAAARSAAIRGLRASILADADEPALLALGVPDRQTALHLFTGLDAAIWSLAA